MNSRIDVVGANLTEGGEFGLREQGIGYVVHQDKVAATGLDCKHGRAFTLADTRRPERLRPWPRPVHGIDRAANTAQRSEEHTSELQSLMRISYAVLCLKKKTKTNHMNSGQTV